MMSRSLLLNFLLDGGSERGNMLLDLIEYRGRAMPLYAILFARRS
jgi:hypothetical protein